MSFEGTRVQLSNSARPNFSSALTWCLHIIVLTTRECVSFRSARSTVFLVIPIYYALRLSARHSHTGLFRVQGLRYRNHRRAR
jgi:hypothetical protein